ncbi:hypothetical protein BBJ29_003376 [Phytophthora kernoviae]|uniref:Glycosyl transferase family 1 domain-containing protein n=1 Tax=Phytophthora kernoviae TaxID=325452 RepID=A0A3F2RLX7_9STRA|nr:hypothetical protein BBP00_00006126 [Phytophthora kernoviae]RLN67510.1 hypothetical protein BBJ29_003376 [Phytophthora kernoviae]
MVKTSLNQVEQLPYIPRKLRECPDVDVFLPSQIRGFGYCEDATAYTKFLESRMLPRWVLEVKFEDKARNRSVTYHDLCPNTPMIFFNHYWEDLLDAPDWPAAKPLYLMPNVEMYELENQELYDGAFKDYDEHIANSTNVIVHTGRLMPGEFGRVIAEGRYFLCPSVMEGYGHYINQARSANAFIVTTDAAPMNELITPSSGAMVRTNVGAYNEQFLGGLSPVEHALRNVSGLVAGFSPDNLCEAVLDVVGNTIPEERERRADKALQQYYFDTVFFAQKMRELRQFARTQSHPSRHRFLRRALEI